MSNLPVHGYTAQSEANIELVSEFKLTEEDILKSLDELARTDVDQRWLSIGRTHIEQGFMAINRSIFKPKRVKIE